MEQRRANQQQAADADDATPRYALVYAIALEGTNNLDGSVEYLEDSLIRFPGDPQLKDTLKQFRDKQNL